MFSWVQDRYFIVTTEKIYNLKKSKIKRSIAINDLSGISKTLKGTRNEFTLHVNKEYDYRFMSERREEIIHILKQHFAERNGINLPIFGIDKVNLSDFTTTEKDKKRGMNRFPPVQFRLIQENVIQERDTQMVKAEVMDQVAIESVMDDYQNNLALRGQMYAESKQVNKYTDEEDEDEDVNG
jgi:Unconventional myosin tail, actin- and lipid-binding